MQNGYPNLFRPDGMAAGPCNGFSPVAIRRHIAGNRLFASDGQRP